MLITKYLRKLLNLKYLLVLFLGINLFSVANAEELLSCANERACRCSSPGLTPVQETYGLDRSLNQSPVYVCRSLVPAVVEVLENGPAVEVDCPPETETLFDRINNSFPQGCGYVLRNFNARAFRETISHYLSTGEVLCGGLHHSMCTSATFLAFLSEIKKRKDAGTITAEQLAEWSNISGPAWQLLNNQARPDLLMTELGVVLGEGATLRRSELPSNEWPKEGDIVQIWRTGRPRSGHSTIFSGYLKNANGEEVAMCFWSSNQGTNGYGRYCETLDQVEQVIVGRFR